MLNYRLHPGGKIGFAHASHLDHFIVEEIGVATINAAIAALRFFFNVTLERPDLARPLTTVNKPRKAPVVLSEEEVARLLEAAPAVKGALRA